MIEERLPVALVLMIVSLICYIIAKRPLLSKNEEKELEELNDIISKMYGWKK